MELSEGTKNTKKGGGRGSKMEMRVMVWCGVVRCGYDREEGMELSVVGDRVLE